MGHGVSVVVADQQDEGERLSMTGLGWALLAAGDPDSSRSLWRLHALVIVAVTTLCAAACYGAIELPDARR